MKYYNIPYSRLWWSNLEQWLEAAEIICSRRASRRTNDQRRCHVIVLSVELIYKRACRYALERVLRHLRVRDSDFTQANEVIEKTPLRRP